MKGSSLFGIALALLSAVCYGSSYAMSPIVYAAGGNSLTLATLRYLILLVVFGGWLVLSRTSLRVPRRLTLPVLVVGLAMFVTSGGNLSAVHFIPVSLAILVFYSYPLMILLIVCLLGRRLPRVPEVIAFILTFTGVGFALNAGFAQLHPAGIALALVGAAGAATVMVVSERTLGELSTLHMTFTTAAVACLGAATVTASMSAFAFPAGSTGAGALAISVGLFAVAMISMFAAVRRIGPVKTSLGLCLEPVAGIMVAVAVIGESFSGRQALGAILVIVGIVIVQSIKHTPPASA